MQGCLTRIVRSGKCEAGQSPALSRNCSPPTRRGRARSPVPADCVAPSSERPGQCVDGDANSPWLLAFLGAALLGLLVAACGGDSNSSGGASGQPSATFPMSVTDTGGKTITFTTAPTRIISYSPGATEILFAIGAGGQAVATDSFSDHP